MKHKKDIYLQELLKLTNATSEGKRKRGMKKDEGDNDINKRARESDKQGVIWVVEEKLPSKKLQKLKINSILMN